MIKALNRLGTYRGGRRCLLPCSVGLSALNALLSLVPFILLWLVVRTLLTAEGDLAGTPLWDYALAAFVVSIVNVLLYFVALMLSHLAAFRVETNMRRSAMKRLMRVPLGFFDTRNTGSMRKNIDEDSGQTHTFVTHILPDVAGSIVAPLGVIILLFAVDWQLGIASVIPFICAFGIMAYMMSPRNNYFQRLYLNAQEKMSAKAVEKLENIARLIPRFWDVCEDSVCIGGIDVRQMDKEELMRSVSFVFPKTRLFKTSIADNIRIGRRDATDGEVHHAARLAQCDDFINRMPQGYDTVIGENGETLSGGERQRISIARALLKNAPIILLDEATASLDAENETKIQAGISELVPGKTVIIIAHRMRTVRNADHIVVLNGGAISEQGTPDELMTKNGEIARMVALQLENDNKTDIAQ